MIEQFTDTAAYPAKLLLETVPLYAALGTVSAGDVGSIELDLIPERAGITLEIRADLSVSLTTTIAEGTHEEYLSVVRRAAMLWADARPALPTTGTVTAGEIYTDGGEMWLVIQTFDRSTFGADPATYPALIRLLRAPWRRYPWHAPTDQYDAFLLVNPLSGAPDETDHDGKGWRTLRNLNVWTPGTADSGWMQVSDTPAPWYYLGAEGYPIGWQVTHNGHLWQAAQANTNWAPGVVGGQFTDLGVYP